MTTSDQAGPPPLPSVYDTGGPRPQQGLGIAVLTLSCLFGGAMLLSSLTSIPVAHDIQGGASIDDAPLAHLGLYALATLAVVPAGIAALVVTGIWQIKVQDNARFLRPGSPQRMARAWAIWGWFVPIASLFVPAKFVHDLYHSTGRHSNGLIGWWWTAWLVALTFDRVQGTMLDDLAPGASASGVDTVAVITLVATAASLALWFLIVRRIVGGQQKQIARHWNPVR